MLRKQIHHLVDQFPAEKLASLLDVIKDYQKYDTYVPRIDGLPVYEMDNPKHVKIIMETCTKNKPPLSIAGKE